MPEISLFVEDSAHEAFLSALIQRLADEYSLYVDVTIRICRGQGRVIKELEEYIRDLRKGRENLRDVLIIAVDANCKGFSRRRQEVEKIASDYKDWLIYAIPDPHVERWLLLDSAAFREALGRGCSAPDYKCSKARYKDLLARAVKMPESSPCWAGSNMRKTSCASWIWKGWSMTIVLWVSFPARSG